MYLARPNSTTAVATDLLAKEPGNTAPGVFGLDEHMIQSMTDVGTISIVDCLGVFVHLQAVSTSAQSRVAATLSLMICTVTWYIFYVFS